MVLLTFDRQAMLHPEYGSHPFEPVPMQLEIAHIKLLGENRWQLRLPVLDVARWGLYHIRRAQRVGHADYALDEYGKSLLFKMDGDTLLVNSVHVDKTVQVPYVKLEATWAIFADEVRVFICSSFPEWARDPWQYRDANNTPSWGSNWSAWLSGQDEEQQSQDHEIDSYFYTRDKHGLDRIDAIEY